MGKDHVTCFASYKYRTFGQIDMGHVVIQNLMPMFFEIVFKIVMRPGPYCKIAAIGNLHIIQIYDRKRCKIPVIRTVLTQPTQPIAYGFNAVQVPAAYTPSNFFPSMYLSENCLVGAEN